jgi:hypothetical protein
MSLNNSSPFVAMPQKRIGATLDAQDLFTTNTDGTTQDSTGTDGVSVFGHFMLRVRGTWTGTLTVQRSDDAGVTWDDVTTGTSGVVLPVEIEANGVIGGFEGAKGVLYRVGFKTGDYGSGEALVEIQS